MQILTACYTRAMEADSTHTQLQALAARLSQLVDVARKLDAENRKLKAEQQDMLSERTQLLQKNDLARSRIEAMIARLKAMEQSV
jgi:cell division protein ZapB